MVITQYGVDGRAIGPDRPTSPHPRSDLIIAVYREELQKCSDASDKLSKRFAPGAALDRWMQKPIDFVVAKRGLASALHSGDPAYAGLPLLLEQTLKPALQRLLDAAAADGEIRPGVDAWDLLRAASSLCTPAPDVTPDHPHRMIAMLVIGLRYAAQGQSVGVPAGCGAKHLGRKRV